MDDSAARAAVCWAVPLIRVAAASCALAVLAASACARTPEPKAKEPSRHVRNQFFVREDAAVAKVEPAPHDGGGDSTAYRYFDDVTDARVIFRKRALHKGSAIGMDLAPMIIICTPIFLPVAKAFGIDPVHFGIILILKGGIGLISPPVGSVLFVGAAIGNISVTDTLKSIWPFYIASFVVLLIVAYVPQLSLWLPHMLK